MGWGADGRITVLESGVRGSAHWAGGVGRGWSTSGTAEDSSGLQLQDREISGGKRLWCNLITVTSSVTFLSDNWGVRSRWGGEGLKQEEKV